MGAEYRTEPNSKCGIKSMSRPCVLRHRVTHYTLCPLVSPEIAIGFEPPIEPWWTLKTPGLACQVSRLDWRFHHRQMNPTGMTDRARAKPLERIGRHTYSSGLDLETKIFSPSGRGRAFFLDIPSYRTH